MLEEIKVLKSIQEKENKKQVISKILKEIKKETIKELKKIKK